MKKKYNYCYPLGKTNFKTLSSSLIQRLKARFNELENEKKQTKQTLPKSFVPDQECSICYEILNKNDDISQCEKQCKQYFHKECILLWLDTSPSCPLCRIQINKSDIDPKFKVINKNIDDPMSFLSIKNININSL